MYSGENEFEACKEALASQSYTNHELVTIENKPNREAHHTLYRTIMEHADEFDLFVKLDADMVFKNDGALERIVDLFASEPALDQAVFAVHDFIPDKLSWGMHTFSNRVKWDLDEEALFVDPNPHYPGKKMDIWNDIEPLVDHAPDPLPYHAFHFGLHRGLKAFQWGRISAHPQAIGMWGALEATWNHFKRTRETKPGLAMMGAEIARKKGIDASGAEKNSKGAHALFESVEEMNPHDMYEQLAPFWENRFKRRVYWYALVYARILPSALLRRIKRMMGLKPKL